MKKFLSAMGRLAPLVCAAVALFTFSLALADAGGDPPSSPASATHEAFAFVRAHWMAIAACAWVAVAFILRKTNRVRANSPEELIFNWFTPRALPVLQAIPYVGPLLAALLKLLDTPEPAAGLAQPGPDNAGRIDLHLEKR
jgi:hypothetical protein